MEKEIKKKDNYYFIVYYKPDENNIKKVRILNKEVFIKNNKNKCKIIYNNKIYELKEYFEDIDINYNHKDLIKIKLIFIHNIIDMSFMFCNCSSLISLFVNFSEFKIWNYMFYGCESLKSLPDIYFLNKSKNNIIFELTYKNNKDKIRILHEDFINNNKNKGIIIYNNSEFELKEYFEDIDNNNNQNNIIKLLLCLDKNINDMSFIFCSCESLISVEYFNKNDINKEFIIESKVNNSLISDHSNIYNSTNQSSLTTRNNLFLRLNSMIKMFYGCKSLTSLPNISYWDTSNVQDMHGMFEKCESLISLPDISNWNTKNVKYMNHLFSYCKSLSSLPDRYIKMEYF